MSIANQICRGLSLEESATLGALLQMDRGTESTKWLSERTTRALTRALERFSGRTGPRLGEQILTRLQRARREAVSSLHPSWLVEWKKSERATSIALATGDTRPTDTPRSAFATELVTDIFAQHAGLEMDPRHRWEHDEGLTLELPQLRFLDRRTTEILLQRVGTRLAIESLRGQGVAVDALVAHAGQNPSLDEDLRQARDTPMEMGKKTLRLAREHFGAAAKEGRPVLTELQSAGLRALVWALAGGAGSTRSMARSMPVEMGQQLLAMGRRSRRDLRAEEVSIEAGRLLLETARGMARDGLAEPLWAQRKVILSPPVEPLADEVGP